MEKDEDALPLSPLYCSSVSSLSTAPVTIGLLLNLVQIYYSCSSYSVKGRSCEIFFGRAKHPQAHIILFICAARKKAQTDLSILTRSQGLSREKFCIMLPSLGLRNVVSKITLHRK